ncbi:unnamed protein product (macronuclear) [Paramecium tetraurelia]|uniref:Cyclic nucleotide-binding domain-containing protein n=1 Tax=Paramecium tetraurelia TaxID=5888 RepID=A0BVD1_PARTE|nr:uncharacterized protein GSPATT00005744001 [Paramecium tetraurelia]CAK62498.1 unnamed protein product [Paramecium tetraurelia]|eukprot:XP_001429896.1 hypothetical protein (macronuclear) [Paramecium tetraurelia strain d4-2]
MFQDQTNQDDVINSFQEKPIKMKFGSAVRKLTILQQFFRYLSKQKKQENVFQSKQIQRKRQKLPFYPDQLYLWKQFMLLQTAVTLMLYPIYISLSDFNEFDSLTIITFLLDALYLIDIILKQITCQIDNNYNLINNFFDIFLFNLQRWLIFDIISIIPYKLFAPTFFDLMGLNLLKLLRFIKYFCYNERQIYQESHNSLEKSEYFEKLFQLDGKILSILKIFKNMLIFISLFGCLFHSVLLYEGLAQKENNYSIYIQGLYWAIQTVTVIGYGDIPLTTSMQYNLTIIWIFIGVGFYSLTIGNLADILDQQSSTDGYEEDLEALETLVQKIIIPEELSNQLFSYFQYNIENNPFWNYRKIIETLPSQLKIFAIAFCQKQLIENVNMFAFNINFAAAILPYFTMYNFKQFDTIYYNGSPSLDVYFLVSGEVRLCDEQGNTLLNIQEGYIFGEIEILEDCYRKQSAVACRDSLVIICPISQFLQLIQDDESLLFEIEQLGLRRKLLLQENLSRIKKNAKQLKRINVIEGDPMTQYVYKKYLLEKQFKANVIKESYQQIHKRLLRSIFGHQQEKKWKHRAMFKMAVRKIIDHLKQSKTQKKTNGVIGKQMLQNFAQVKQQELKIQNQIYKNKKNGKDQQRVKVKDILNHFSQKDSAPMLITPYPYYEEILKERKEEKQQLKQKQNKIQELSNRLIKINLIGQYQICNTLYEDLIEQIDILYDAQYQTHESQDQMESVYYQIYSLVSSID